MSESKGEKRLNPIVIELSIEEGCILWGSRVVLPPQAGKKMVTELHNGHPGIAKMKNLARQYVWWPRWMQP